LTARRVCAPIPGVPEYDAFGREIGDDPLAGLRDAVNPPQPVVASPEPVVAAPGPEPAAAAPPRPQFVRPRRRRSGGLAGLLVIVAIVGAVGLVGNAAVEKGQDIIEQVTPQLPAAPPTGLERASLIREHNFGPALKTLSAARLGRPMAIRVAPDRIDATLVKGTRLHQVQITPDGALRELGSGDAPATRGVVAYAGIDPGAPARVSRSGAPGSMPA